MDRIEIGARVCDRLGAVPGIRRAPTTAIDLFLLRDFLSRDECAALFHHGIEDSVVWPA